MKNELRCVFDTRASFYRKAFVIESEKSKVLISYDTKVCIISKNTAQIMQDINLSNTTLRHIKEFLRQNSLAVGTKKELVKMYS